MTVQSQETSIRYHLLCIISILEDRAENVFVEYRQLIVGLAIGFVLGVIVLLPALIVTPVNIQTPYIPDTSFVPTSPNVELTDTEISGDISSGFNITGRMIADNSPVNWFECSINNEEFAPCSSEVVFPKLAAGNYTFEARSVLSNGTVDPTPAVWIGSVR